MKKENEQGVKVFELAYGEFGDTTSTIQPVTVPDNKDEIPKKVRDVPVKWVQE